MKTAIIYYSYEGNSVLVADLLKNELDAEIFEIKTVDTKKRKGFSLILWGAFQVMGNKKPELRSLPIDINAFDLIILGTPVWVGSPAPAMVSFLNQTKITGKKLALFCCHGGGMGKIFDKVKALLTENEIISEIDFKYPAKAGRDELKGKICDWAKTLRA